jgi:hypothetical protein
VNELYSKDDSFSAGDEKIRKFSRLKKARN